jgi:hypothetical protein
MMTKLRIEVAGGVVTAVYKVAKNKQTLLVESKDYDLIDYDDLEEEVVNQHDKRSV